MFGVRLARSLEIVMASAAILREEKKFLLFPLFSGLAVLLVGGFFVWDAFAAGFFEKLKSGAPDLATDVNVYVWMFIVYVALYFIVIFFNTALAGAAIAKLNGGDPTIVDAFRLAFSRIGSIFGYAIIAGTVGLLLRLLANRGIIGRIIGGTLDLAWTVVTFLVVPVLAAEGVGPVEAVKKSARLLRISLVVSGIIGVVAVLAHGGALLLGGAGHRDLAIVVYLLAAAIIIPVATIGAALTGIYSAALYTYAAAGEPPEGFGSLIRTAFRPKA